VQAVRIILGHVSAPSWKYKKKTVKTLCLGKPEIPSKNLLKAICICNNKLHIKKEAHKKSLSYQSLLSGSILARTHSTHFL
jgi:hypothetical protein